MGWIINMDVAEAKNSNGNSASVKGHDQVLKSSMNEGRMVGGTSNKNYQVAKRDHKGF